MHPTTYHKPATVAEAVSLLASAEDAKLLAGGQTLLPTMKAHLATPANLIDIRKVAGLAGISAAAGILTIGAATTHATVANDAMVNQHVPALARLAAGIGDPAVRHMGTIGGSLANNDPAADYPSAALALGATIVTNVREIPADAYFTGMFSTALEDGEIITAVKFPAPKRAAYAKFPNPASRYAMVGVFVAETANGVRVAVTGAGEGGVFRHKGMEAALTAKFGPDSLEIVTVSSDGLLSDLHADAAYRAHLIKVMAKRAVAAAVG